MLNDPKVREYIAAHTIKDIHDCQPIGGIDQSIENNRRADKARQDLTPEGNEWLQEKMPFWIAGEGTKWRAINARIDLLAQLPESEPAPVLRKFSQAWYDRVAGEYAELLIEARVNTAQLSHSHGKLCERVHRITCDRAVFDEEERDILVDMITAEPDNTILRAELMDHFDGMISADESQKVEDAGLSLFRDIEPEPAEPEQPKLSDSQIAFIMKQGVAQPAQDIPAEYAALKAKYGPNAIARCDDLGDEMRIILYAEVPEPTQFVADAVGVARFRLNEVSSGIYLMPMVYAIADGGLNELHYQEYLILKAYDEMQAVGDAVQATEDQIAAEGELPVKTVDEIMRLTPEERREGIKAGIRTYQAAMAHKKAAAKRKVTLPVYDGLVVDENHDIIGLPADDYPEDLRPALMLPKGDVIREAAVKVLLARKRK